MVNLWYNNFKINLSLIAEKGEKKTMKIVLGSDSYGFNLKQTVKSHLLSKGLEIEDIGVKEANEETPYYEIATRVAQTVATQQVNRGILVCGTGMGMAIIANKYPGIYAAVCETIETAQMSRSINNANILTLGELITTPHLAKKIIDIWLTTEFTEGWETPIQEWLHQSMKDIAQIESQKFINYK
ncbi:MAG: RpiB/LacA/LacB family sugar-phosphate isomerase [Crocosphaera sp.]|nr:RpiB/LacA/LacB family sugar-phosphate isomerase [Crocosphaera sp.]